MIIIGYDNGTPITKEVVRNDAQGYAKVKDANYAYDWTPPATGGLPKPGPGVAPAAGKPYFLIHDPQLARCGAGSSNFKGLNATTGTITLPAAKSNNAANPVEPIEVDNGVKAGPTRSRRVPGVAGCDLEQNDGCVMILPVVDDSGPGGTGNSIIFAGRLWAAFWVQEIPKKGNSSKDDKNSHGAYLIKDYPITATGTTGWTPSYGGPVVVGLVP